MKKLKIMIFIIILSFSFFLLIYNHKRDYELSYKKDEYSVKEKYIKEKNLYLVSVKKGNDEYNYIIDKKYSKSRKLVDNIKLYKTDDEKCLTITFNKEHINPVCKKENSLISYYLVSEKMQKKLGKKYYNNKVKTNKETYKKIEINSLLDKKILVWNYSGFYYLSSDKKETINLLKKDVYNPSLISQIDNYLLIPNYDKGYEYNSFIVLNVDNLTKKDFVINDNISNDSYVLGTYDKSIFIFDKKYEKEYEFVPYKQKYRTVNPFIYNKDKKESKSSVYLSNNEATFIYDYSYDYVLEKNKIYQVNTYTNEKKLISNKEVKDIVKENNNEVYYLSDDTLYYYSDKYGEVKMLSYFELNFNYNNIIYIFD